MLVRIDPPASRSTTKNGSRVVRLADCGTATLCHSNHNCQRTPRSDRAASMASPPRSYGATTDTRPVNTAEYERLLGDAVSGIERTEALGTYDARRSGGSTRRLATPRDVRRHAAHHTRRQKSLRALYCRLLREKLCLSTTIAILFTVDVFLFYLLLRHGGRFRSDDDS